MPQLDKVASVNTKRFLDSLGFGWLLNTQQKIGKIPLNHTDLIPLKGNFDWGYALGRYSESKEVQPEKTYVGRLLYRFKYRFDRDAGVILADLAAELINSRNLLRSSDLIFTVPPSSPAVLLIRSHS